MKKQINEIITLIHRKKDYEKAAKILLKNKLTISSLAKTTYKISLYEYAKLADEVKKIKA